MNIVERAVGLLDNWSGSRDPTPADVQHMIGSWAARSMIQYFFVERMAAVAWLRVTDWKQPPQAPYIDYDGGTYVDYNFWTNYFSDLGARGCHTLDQGLDSQRYVCSPLFALADLSIMIMGTGVLVAAALITSTVLRLGGKYEAIRAHNDAERPGNAGRSNVNRLFRHLDGEHFGHELTWEYHLTTVTRFLMGIAGIALILVGAFPEDYSSTMHDVGTMIFLVCAVAALVCLVILWWKSRPVATALIALSTLVAAVGGAVLLFAMIFSFNVTLRGLFERMIIYGFIAGMTVMGVALGGAAREERRNRREAHAANALAAENRDRQRWERFYGADREHAMSHRARARIVTLNGRRSVGLIDIQGEPQVHPERAGEG